MGFLKTAKTEVITDAAQAAHDEGAQFYILEAGSSFTKASGGTVAQMLEAVEDIGWKLEHVSHVWSTDGANHAVGFYVFRRG